MKKIFLIGGTMGIGKTAVGQLLKRKLSNAVFLDGDWCWDADPFHMNEETKKMVQDNIYYMLNNFIHCSAYENVIFCWVMHEQKIIDDLLANIDAADCEVIVVSLICTPEALRKRINIDIEIGIRSQDVLERSIKRIPLYKELKTTKIDVSTKTPEEVANMISTL
jgi:broad-specificity NMP kinase